MAVRMTVNKMKKSITRLLLDKMIFLFVFIGLWRLNWLAAVGSPTINFVKWRGRCSLLNW